MAKPPLRTLQVIDKTKLSKHMQRITLGGKALEGFPLNFEGGYIKLMLNPSLERNQNTPPLEPSQLIKRSFTIRHYDEEAQQLQLDFVSHGDSGPASTWANHCQIGDAISISGPGAVKLVDNNADWFFIAGDMTAIPAISVNLEQLPETAKGYAVIEVINEEDIITLESPEGIEFQWVINPQPDQANTLLADKVKTLKWLEGKPSVWAACEFETMRALRRYFKQEKKVARDNIYISSYWKMGDTDEGNKLAKKQDPESNI